MMRCKSHSRCIIGVEKLEPEECNDAGAAGERHATRLSHIRARQTGKAGTEVGLGSGLTLNEFCLK